MSESGSSAVAPRAAAVAFSRVAGIVTGGYMGAQVVGGIASLKNGVGVGVGPGSPRARRVVSR